MTKKAWANALLAVVYIVLVSSLMFWGTQHQMGRDSVLAPIAMLSLLTFSAATMAYLFLYQPFVLYFENRKKQAVDLFLQTLMYFGMVTVIVFGCLFLIK